MNTRLVRYNPWNEAATLTRLMNNALNTNLNWDSQTPAVNVKESNESYTIQAELPGWNPEDVEITFEKGVVTLKGEAKTEAEQSETEKWHAKEIRKVSFARNFKFPADVEADKATAEFEHGVLTLTLPKAEVVKPKQIKIAVK